MALVTSNQFQLVPDLPGSLSRGINLGEQFKQQKLQEQQDQFLQGGGMQSQTALQDSSKLGLDFQLKVAKGLGLQDQRTGQINQKGLIEAADFAFNAQDKPVEQQNTMIASRIKKLESEGRDATQTRELLKLPPEQRKKPYLAVQIAALPNDVRLSFLKGQAAGTSEREFNNLIANFTPEEQLKAKKIKAGLEGRAMGSAAQTITNLGTAKDVAGTEATLAEGRESGKLSAELALSPKVKEATNRAIERVKLESEIGANTRSNSKALAVYESGIKSLSDALGGTDTGFFAGKVPAFSSNQQIADGAVAIMAPIFKQMFRSAGEGNFTDSDQKILMQMVPTRSDSSEARASKLQMIDSVVRAKLSSATVSQENGVDELTPEEQAELAALKAELGAQ